MLAFFLNFYYIFLYKNCLFTKIKVFWKFAIIQGKFVFLYKKLSFMIKVVNFVKLETLYQKFPFCPGTNRKSDITAV